jgi:23S rRNA pseudouridine2605 synthase
MKSPQRNPRSGKPAPGKPEFRKKAPAKPDGRREFSSDKYTGKPAPKKAPAKPKTGDDSIRLNKYIANSGVCSRREADIYIQSGSVRVNGEPVTEMGYKVMPGDTVVFDGQTLTPEKKVYVLLNKPKNFTTSGDDDNAMRNVSELVRTASKTPLSPIGRMDKNTTGLLLFTNDNDLINKFSKGPQKSPKLYQVTLDKNLKFEDLEKIAGGVTLDDHRLNVDEIQYVDNASKTEIGLQLRTANVKVVRAIFEKFGYNVLKVDRVMFAGLTKKNLARGIWRHLTEQEVINLKHM